LAPVEPYRENIVKSCVVDGHEVAWDGRTVWVNSGTDGTSIGRFSHAGIDVHKPASEQSLSGNPCLACSHRGGESMTAEDWQTFRALVLEHYSIDVPEDAMPDYLKEPS
jgi:hypothetical protein